MPDGNVLPTMIAVLSLVVAMTSVGWNVASWRRAGPVLRVQALLFDDVLEVRIFNAGRTAESLEAVVLGGSRHGRGGIDLSGEFACPRVLPPSESLRVPLNWRQLAPGSRQGLLRAGWESLWILRGSMREQRADALPVGARFPRGPGWILVSRHSSQTRYVPLLMAVPYVAIVFDAQTHAASIGTFFAISLLVLLYRLHSAVVKARPCWRRRIENVTVVIGALAVLVGWTAHADLTYLVVAYLAWAALLAWPGAVSGLLREGRSVGDRWHSKGWREAGATAGVGFEGVRSGGAADS